MFFTKAHTMELPPWYRNISPCYQAYLVKPTKTSLRMHRETCV